MSVTLVIVIALVLGVVFVNGWTDAPNAIATVVSTRAMNVKAAVIMAAIFNFLGVLIMTVITSEVAVTVSKLVSFGDSDPKTALVALAAGLFAIVVWATAAWYFGIPTSESHALIAGVTGAGLSLVGWKAFNPTEWMKVLQGLGISTVLGVLSGLVIVKILELICKNMRRRATTRFFGGAQIAGGAFMAFIHGAQDGQKFMGVFMIGYYLSTKGDVPEPISIPFWVMVLCSAVMGIGTSVGGYRIIKAVGMDMAKLEKYQGFAADLAAGICLLFSTLQGIPISTTHTKTTAIMGVGASKRLSNVNWKVVGEMVLGWVLTFPGCALLGYLMSKLFQAIFI